ncbi:MAG TPA: 4-hydroxy-tetrahydrodipicolinate reductase [Longimicrobiales bacterium]|nr:4-hydroxy-tetrahydrodipicolinate reductase [Longimicrobiales bacterium]
MSRRAREVADAPPPDAGRAKPLRLAVVGATGRMGRRVAALAAEAGVEVVGGVADLQRSEEEARAAGYPRIVAPEHAAGLIEGADVVLDFSSPKALAEVLDLAEEALAGRALVVGTTGLGAAQERRLDDVARSTAVLVAANFSVGVNLLLSVAERMAAALPAAAYDVEIVEAHHRAKVDAPSGTALALAAAVARGRGVPLEGLRRDGRSGAAGPRPEGEIGIHALRGGSVAGEHRLHFLGGRERIELAHTASDRDLFAEGALLACRWARGRPPGRYGMRDVLDL